VGLKFIREFERFLRAAGFSRADAKAITSAGWVAADRRPAGRAN
jgi:hypothetical protein